MQPATCGDTCASTVACGRGPRLRPVNLHSMTIIPSPHCSARKAENHGCGVGPAPGKLPLAGSGARPVRGLLDDR